MSNHLGNVLVTVSDKRIAVDSDNDGLINYYNADVVTANDYYPGGMQMPGRTFQAGSRYRYGFNGKEKSDEIAEGDLDFGARIMDVRLGRWLAVDPMKAKYTAFSPYNFAINNPISNIDYDGRDIIIHAQSIEDLLAVLSGLNILSTTRNGHFITRRIMSMERNVFIKPGKGYTSDFDGNKVLKYDPYLFSKDEGYIEAGVYSLGHELMHVETIFSGHYGIFGGVPTEEANAVDFENELRSIFIGPNADFRLDYDKDPASTWTSWLTGAWDTDDEKEFKEHLLDPCRNFDLFAERVTLGQMWAIGADKKDKKNTYIVTSITQYKVGSKELQEKLESMKNGVVSYFTKKTKDDKEEIKMASVIEYQTMNN